MQGGRNKTKQPGSPMKAGSRAGLSISMVPFAGAAKGRPLMGDVL